MPKTISLENKTKKLAGAFRLKYCDTFLTQLRGLMFRSQLSRDEGLVLVGTRDSRLESSIHMFFVPFDLAVFWILCVALAGPMRHAGVALATAAGFWINFLALLALLRKRLGRLGGRAIGAGLLRLALASLGMGAIVWVFSERLLPYRMIWSLPLRIGWVGSVAALGAVTFIVFANLLGAPEVGEVLGAFRKKKAVPLETKEPE